MWSRDWVPHSGSVHVPDPPQGWHAGSSHSMTPRTGPIPPTASIQRATIHQCDLAHGFMSSRPQASPWVWKFGNVRMVALFIAMALRAINAGTACPPPDCQTHGKPHRLDDTAPLANSGLQTGVKHHLYTDTQHRCLGAIKKYSNHCHLGTIYCSKAAFYMLLFMATYQQTV